MVSVLQGTDLKQRHHQVGHAQIHHEHVHGCVVLPPPQQHPQNEAVPQGGESQHQAQHGDLGPGQAQVPASGLGQRVGRGGGAIVWEDAEEGAAAVGTVDGVQLRHKQGRGGEVAPPGGHQRGEA